MFESGPRNIAVMRVISTSISARVLAVGTAGLSSFMISASALMYFPAISSFLSHGVRAGAIKRTVSAMIFGVGAKFVPPRFQRRSVKPKLTHVAALALG